MQQTVTANQRGTQNAVSVRLEGIVKKFGKVTAVEKVDLELPAGKLVTLLGPSGCGKTTILRMVAGLERPTEGRILFGGEDVTRLPAYLRDITMMFQSYALFPHMNVYQNIAYGLQVTRRPKEEIRERVAEVVRLVGLTGLEERPVAALSGGQQQRVALARSLVMQPRILLFDEPLSNLDAKLRKRVREEIRDIQQELGITSLYVTHDQEEAMAISDLVVLMNKGVIEQQGDPRTLYTRPVSRFAADFIGRANFIEGHYSGGLIQVAGYSQPHQQSGISGKVTVMVRPEALRVFREGEGLEGTMHGVAFLGSSTEFSVDTAVGRLEGVVAGDAPELPGRGEKVKVQFAPQGTFLLPG
ncbi:ABC transporter ATP-binding protein [Meiothermus cerbereus]|uniref:ABC transporter ATP-binding protein n=3 Tax=Meiothermus cerbereus TaxID=65552 RepID=UPI00055FDEE1|nr:ABC transporter ATP-binding protein [Meiothermus cerbereus]